MNLHALKSEQLELARKIVVKNDFKKIDTIGACDQVFYSNKVLSVVVVCDKDMKVVEQKHAILDVKMPYTSGFQFYREGPAVMEAFSQLAKKPSVLMVEANGILHPLRIGMASQLGLVLDVPTIGVAKILLCGEVEDGMVLVNKEIRGAQLKTREFSKPIFISPGHRISLETSAELVKESMRDPHKLPEQLHIAHKTSNKMRKGLMQEISAVSTKNKG